MLAVALVLGGPAAAQAWIIPPAYLAALPPRTWHAPSCVQPEPGKRTVKLALEPDTDLADLLDWIATITCRSYLLPGTIPTDGKRVTIVGPELVTPEEVHHDPPASGSDRSRRAATADARAVSRPARRHAGAH